MSGFIRYNRSWLEAAHAVPSKSEIAEFVRGGARDLEDNPMDQEIQRRIENLKLAPRCAARTRAGGACQRPAIHGRRRCRLHGGLSPGAPRGAKNGNFRNGNWSADAIEERRWLL